MCHMFENVEGILLNKENSVYNEMKRPTLTAVF